jgi:hypothetical protein
LPGNLSRDAIGAREGERQGGKVPSGTATPDDVARWMLDELERKQRLSQVEAVIGIARAFGPGFLHENRNSRPAIDKRVLRAFRSLADATVIWDRAEFCWLKRRGDAGPVWEDG